LYFKPDYFYDKIKEDMETFDNPVAFGQHVNAEINSQILDTVEILGSILTITPQDVSGGGEGGAESGMQKKVKDYIDKIPELIDRFVLK